MHECLSHLRQYFPLRDISLDITGIGNALRLRPIRLYLRRYVDLSQAISDEVAVPQSCIHWERGFRRRKRVSSAARRVRDHAALPNLRLWAQFRVIGGGVAGIAANIDSKISSPFGSDRMNFSQIKVRWALS